MPFDKKDLPEWNPVGVEPPQSHKDNGWGAGEKPPADWFNWLFNKTYTALQNLFTNAQHKEEKGKANGYAALDADGKVINADGTQAGGVQSVNKKTGTVTLSASDVGAEPAFNKNTAFNKNFGTTNGTVAEGNHTHDFPVTSVNKKTGNVNLSASDVGAETPEKAQEKANAAEANANDYTDSQLAIVEQEITDLGDDVARHKADKASKTKLGHVQIGNGISVDENGVISVPDFKPDIDSLKSSVSDGKILIRNTITDNGGNVADADGDGIPTFQELSDGVKTVTVANPSKTQYAVANEAIKAKDMVNVIRYGAPKFTTVRAADTPRYSGAYSIYYVSGNLFVTCGAISGGHTALMLVEIVGTTVTIVQQLQITDVAYSESDITPKKDRLITVGLTSTSFGTVTTVSIDAINKMLTLGTTTTVTANAGIGDLSVKVLDENGTRGIIGYHYTNYQYVTFFNLDGLNVLNPVSKKIGVAQSGNGVVIGVVDANTALVITRAYNASNALYYLARFDGTNITNSAEYSFSSFGYNYPSYGKSDSMKYDEDATYKYIKILYRSVYDNIVWYTRIPKDPSNMTFMIVNAYDFYDSTSGQLFGDMHFMPNTDDAYFIYQKSDDFSININPYNLRYKNPSNNNLAVGYGKYGTSLSSSYSTYPSSCIVEINNMPRVVTIAYVNSSPYVAFILADYTHKVKKYLPTDTAPIVPGVAMNDIANGAQGKIQQLAY